MRDVVMAGHLRTAQSRARPKDPSRDWLHKRRADGLLARIPAEREGRYGCAAACIGGGRGTAIILKRTV
jgi:acetyl-CoA C-acetyltransferase